MRRNYLALLGLAGIVALSAYLRFHNLDTNPGWDADEGYNINIAWNLSQGRLQMYALSYAFVQHPPLFYALLAPIFGIMGANILALRILASVFGLLTNIVLFFLARDLAGQKVAFFSSAMFAIYPVAVAFNRLGYTYNQLMFFAILCLYSCWRFLAASNQKPRTAWAVGAGLAAGLGATTDQEGAFLIAFVIAVVALARRKCLLVAAASSLVLPLAYVMTMLALVPGDFIYDLQHNVGRVSENGPLVEALITAFNYEQFLDFSYWLPMGIVGLFLLRDRKAKLVVIGFFFLMLVFILKIRNPNPFFRTAIPVLPIAALGMGVFTESAVRHLFHWGQQLWEDALGDRAKRFQSPAITLVTFVILFLPLGVMAATDLVEVQTKLPTSIDNFLANAPGDAVAMADVLNERARRDDLVLASSNVSWLLRARTADLLQAVAAEGGGTAFYPANLPRHRFVYDAKAQSARFVVVDDFSRLWSSYMPQERGILDQVTGSWKKVYQVGEYQVFENPGAR